MIKILTILKNKNKLNFNKYYFFINFFIYYYIFILIYKKKTYI